MTEINHHYYDSNGQQQSIIGVGIRHQASAGRFDTWDAGLQSYGTIGTTRIIWQNMAQQDTTKAPQQGHPTFS